MICLNMPVVTVSADVIFWDTAVPHYISICRTSLRPGWAVVNYGRAACPIPWLDSKCVHGGFVLSVWIWGWVGKKLSD